MVRSFNSFNYSDLFCSELPLAQAKLRRVKVSETKTFFRFVDQIGGEMFSGSGMTYHDIIDLPTSFSSNESTVSVYLYGSTSQQTLKLQLEAIFTQSIQPTIVYAYIFIEQKSHINSVFDELSDLEEKYGSDRLQVVKTLEPIYHTGRLQDTIHVRYLNF